MFKPIIHNLTEKDGTLYILTQEYNKKIGELNHAKNNSKHLNLKDKVNLYRHLKNNIRSAFYELEQYKQLDRE